MTTLTTQVNNANNKGNQQRDMRMEPIRVSRGGNNHVFIAEILSYEEENLNEEEIVDNGNQHNHDYQVKADISLFY